MREQGSLKGGEGGAHKGNFIACVQIHKNPEVRIYSFIKGL